jgi:Domain of unknown function (DUF4118)
MPEKFEYDARRRNLIDKKKPAGGRLKVKSNLFCVGLIGALSVGFIVLLMGAPWWSPLVCGSIGLLIGWLFVIGYADTNARLTAGLRLLRALPLWDRVAMSIVLVISATTIYIASRDLSLYGAFCLFLVPVVLAQVLFGTKSGLAAALASQIAIHYFAIPPKNSFAVHSMREVGLLCAFALMALIVWMTIALLSDVARGKTRRVSRN